MLAPAQLDPADLARQRLGQLVHELDQAGIGVGGEAIAHEPFDLLGELVGGAVAVGEHDEGLDDRSAALAGRSHGRGLAAAARAGCARQPASTANGPMRYPAAMITSSARPSYQT